MLCSSSQQLAQHMWKAAAAPSSHSCSLHSRTMAVPSMMQASGLQHRTLCTSPALLAPRRLTSRLAVITTASKGKGPAASAPKKKGAAASSSSSSSSAKPPSSGASGAAAAATAGTAGAGAAAASHGNAHTVVVKAASAAVLTVEAEVSSVVTTRVVAPRRRRISRGDGGHGMIIGDDDCDDECDSFAGGALGTGEIDVAVADSDEELDGSGGSEHIVPAGVLGAAGLAGVAVGDGAARSNGNGNHRCLVLDAAYRPINTINWFKAVMMDIAGKVDVIDYYDDAYAYSAYRAHSLPAVLRARASVNMHELVGRAALTRRNILSRDRHMCQYCGSRQNLTLDHVLPVCRGGRNTWDNLVTCCMHCNQRKGGALLKDLGWRLRTVPREPTSRDLGIVLGVNQSDLDNPPEKWSAWLAPYRSRKDRASAAASASAVAAVAAVAGASGAASPAPQAAR